MALFPCAVGLHRYPGPQRSAYLGVASGALSARSKMRLCKEHFQDLTNFCSTSLRHIATGDTFHEDEPGAGESCLQHSDEPAEYRLYATLYPQGAEALVYFALACQDCADGFRRVGQIELS